MIYWGYLSIITDTGLTRQEHAVRLIFVNNMVWQ